MVGIIIVRDAARGNMVAAWCRQLAQIASTTSRYVTSSHSIHVTQCILSAYRSHEFLACLHRSISNPSDEYDRHSPLPLHRNY